MMLLLTDVVLADLSSLLKGNLLPNVILSLIASFCISVDLLGDTRRSHIFMVRKPQAIMVCHSLAEVSSDAKRAKT